MKLNLLWERTEGRKIEKKPFFSFGTGVDFYFNAYSSETGGYQRLSYPVFGKLDKDYENDYYSKLSVSEDIKKAVRRCTHIISSEAFLTKVPGRDFVDTIVDECNKDAGCPSLLIRNYLYPSAYYEFRSVYLKERHWIPGQLERAGDLFHPLAQGILSMGKFMDRIVVDMEVVQYHFEKKGQNGKYFRTSKDDHHWTNDIKRVADFQVCLRLFFNMRTDALEKAILYDRFVVNKVLSYNPRGQVIFEKEHGK